MLDTTPVTTAIAAMIRTGRDGDVYPNTKFTARQGSLRTYASHSLKPSRSRSFIDLSPLLAACSRR